MVNTHVAPSYTKNPHNDDIYSAYNKPESIISWLENTDVKEEYVLILDADMVMRATFTPDEFQAEKGHPVSAFYGYLKGVGNELALKHIPEVPPTNDFEAGPFGRRGTLLDPPTQNRKPKFSRTNISQIFQKFFSSPFFHGCV